MGEAVMEAAYRKALAFAHRFAEMAVPARGEER
jgi:hypothetical protein